MALYFVKHTHDEGACPAQNPEQGNRLLKHLAPENTRQYGVKLHADAVIDGKHTLNLILEADKVEDVSQFMTPFKMVGSVEIFPASHCENVVERKGC